MQSRAPRLIALVPCAGIGSRAQTAMPKQYAGVAGQSVIAHTIKALRSVSRLHAVLVVLAPDDAGFDAAVPAGLLNTVESVRCGGATRAHTVLAGIEHLRQTGYDDSDWVLVHDAARCLIDAAAVDRLIDACLDDEVGGLLALPLSDTLKLAEGERASATLDRRDKWLAQTPQMFRLGLLQRALSRLDEGITDEASAVERLGLKPKLVRGEPTNFKITWPDEFALAERWMSTR